MHQLVVDICFGFELQISSYCKIEHLWASEMTQKVKPVVELDNKCYIPGNPDEGRMRSNL